MSEFLLIQTAFIGDVILATALVEKLAAAHPDAAIDFLLRKGNEPLLANNPHIRQVLVWDKSRNKLGNLVRIIKDIRRSRYHVVIDIHRFSSSGMITALSGAKTTIGFDKNPLSFFFTKKVKHVLENKHEIERNQELLAGIADGDASRPKLYPSESDYRSIRSYNNQTYVCIAPGSVWFTKQLPAEKWLELMKKLDCKIFLLGGPDDRDKCNLLKSISERNVTVLAGELSFLQTAALMKNARMNYVNDSAPLHMASAMDAPVTAVFCSTVPEFGFGPLSRDSRVVQTGEHLACRPCGLHGFGACPQGHFKCANTIHIPV